MGSEILKDEELVELAMAGDDSAMDELLARYRWYVKARARAFFLVGSEVEDLIQEGMIGLYKAARDYSDDKNTTFKSFARMCINRKIITAIRGANREKHRALNNCVSLNAPIGTDGDENVYIDIVDDTHESNPENAIISKEIVENVRYIIDKVLNEQDRKILKLYLGGKSYVAISAELNVNVKRVDNALQKIRKKLQKSIEI